MYRLIRPGKGEESVRNLTNLSVELNRMFFDLSQEGPMEYRDAHPKRETTDLIERVRTEKHLKKKIRRIVERFPHDWPTHDQAAYLLRAYSGLQLFPDANHRTGLAIMRFHLNRQGYELAMNGDDLQHLVEHIRNPRSPYSSRCNAGQLLERNDCFEYISATIQANLKKKPWYRNLRRFLPFPLQKKIPPTLLFTPYEDPKEEMERKTSAPNQ